MTIPALEDADHALVRLEALLHVERRPDAALFVLGEAHVVVEEAVALGAPEGHLGPRVSPADGHQGPGPADDRVGQIARTEGREPGVHADLVADGPVDQEHAAEGRGRGREGRHAWSPRRPGSPGGAPAAPRP